MKTTQLAQVDESPAPDVIQIAMQINREAGSVHAWLFLKRQGMSDEVIYNLLLHKPSLAVVH
jgi:hypothetical protein